MKDNRTLFIVQLRHAILRSHAASIGSFVELVTMRVTDAAQRRIVQEIPVIEGDRFLAPYLKAAETLARSEALREAVEAIMELN